MKNKHKQNKSKISGLKAASFGNNQSDQMRKRAVRLMLIKDIHELQAESVIDNRELLYSPEMLSYVKDKIGFDPEEFDVQARIQTMKVLVAGMMIKGVTFDSWVLFMYLIDLPLGEPSRLVEYTDQLFSGLTDDEVIKVKLLFEYRKGKDITIPQIREAIIRDYGRESELQFVPEGTNPNSVFNLETDSMDKRLMFMKRALADIKEKGITKEGKDFVSELCLFKRDPNSPLSEDQQKVKHKEDIMGGLSLEEKETLENVMTEILIETHKDLDEAQKDVVRVKREWIVATLALDAKEPLDLIQRKELVRAFEIPDDKTRKLLTDSLTIEQRKRVTELFRLDQQEQPKLQEDARLARILEDWVQTHDFSIIQKNEAPRTHKVADALQRREIYPRVLIRKEEHYVNMVEAFTKIHSIVVKHNWAAAIGEDLRTKADESVEVKLPYPSTFFEFMMHGKCVIALSSEQEDGRIANLLFVEAEKDKWFEVSQNDEAFDKLHNAVTVQIEAICVALEAKIAESSEVKPIEALNKKRLKAGKLPMNSHHVVDLSKRFQNNRIRSSDGVKPDDDGPKVRLHWRRRHTRRFKNGHPPIVIEWMLVGNIDLGFVEKHYLM